jgi:hypothetical protein
VPFVFTAALFAVWYGTAVAAPTPMPGGANQLNGLQGTLQSTIFNAKMRVRKMQLRPSTPDERSTSAGSTAITFVYLASNGTSARIYHALFEDEARANIALTFAMRHVREQREALGVATATRGFDRLATIRAIVAAHEEDRWP